MRPVEALIPYVRNARMWRPGKLRFLIAVKNPLAIGRPRTPENTAPCGAPPVARFATPVGLRPPFVAHPATLPHPDRRARFILFAAQHFLAPIAGKPHRAGGPARCCGSQRRWHCGPWRAAGHLLYRRAPPIQSAARRPRLNDFWCACEGRKREPPTKKLGRQGPRNLEGSAGVVRKPLKLWWVQ